MSTYTDLEHLWAINETKKWESTERKTAKDYLEYGLFQYRLHDYYKAVDAFQKALVLEENNPDAAYWLVWCMRFEQGCHMDTAAYEKWSRIAFSHYQKQLSLQDSSQLASCYLYGIGTSVNMKKAKAILEQIEFPDGKVLYELGLIALEESKQQVEKKQTALEYFRKSYDLNYEEAIFAHYKASGENFREYPYQREIKEAYSYRLGQAIRVATVSPCQDSFKRVAELYEHGYPGDEGEEDLRFKQKAVLYRKEQELAKEEYSLGVFTTYPNSEMYQNWICKKNMSEFEQSGFLEESFL